MRIFIFSILFSVICLSAKSAERKPYIDFSFDSSDLFYRGELRIGLYQDYTLDTERITHIIVVGSAVKEDSNGFFQSGIARAVRYKEIWPDHQVVIMSSPEVKDRRDEEVFNDFNIPVIKKINKTFTAEIFLGELSQFSRIASLDFYGHSSPWSLKLGKANASISPEIYSNQLINLRPHFLPDAYITLNSCNSGYYTAPDLSRILEIPVAGSLTSSLLERIESDGKWYKEDDWSKENYVTSNPFSFNENISCDSGVCWRMKPGHANYSSYWGTFNEGGLSFSKFFCNFEQKNTAKCEKAMALSLLTFPSVKPLSKKPSLADFKDVAFDWICSTFKNRSRFQECVKGINAAILRGDLIYQSHTTTELNCNFKTCNATVVCKEKKIGKGPKGGSCKLNAAVADQPTNAAREMLSFLKGFELL
ncbi:MAG: hypothetical protein WC635_10415 [Bacteriovorax sp.]|jgi:hypothetical protein